MPTCKRCGKKPARIMSDMCGECLNLTSKEVNPDSTADDRENMVSVEVYAQRKGLTSSEVMESIRKGSLVGQMVAGIWYVDDDAQAKPTADHNVLDPNPSPAVPGLARLFFVFAVLSLIGGIVLSAAFWPGDPGFMHMWKKEAYLLSIIWLTAGLIEAAGFAAVGQVLVELRRIEINTRSNRAGAPNSFQTQ